MSVKIISRMVLETKKDLEEFFFLKYPIDVDQLNHYVYVLFRNNVIVYIGKTWNYTNRISAHKRDKNFDSFLLIRCASLEESVMLERDMQLSMETEYNTEYKHLDESDRKLHKSIVKSWFDIQYSNSEMEFPDSELLERLEKSQNENMQQV